MQTKTEIITAFREKWSEVESLIVSVNDEEFINKPNADVWSVAQEFDHVIKGAAALCSAMKRKPFLLKWKFGKPNRPIRSYEESLIRYQEKLAMVNGKVRAPSPFQSAEDKIFNKNEMLGHWDSTLQKFEARISNWSDKNLDRVLLPHPLLGKMMVRELLYFTHFHTEHHRKGLKKKIDSLINERT